MVKDRGLPAYRGRIADNAVTIAEMLQDAGYQTAMTGKWHVSHDIDPEGTKKDWPLQRGFKRFYGTLTGHGSFWNPKCLYEGNDPAPAEGDYYYTEQIAGMASSYIEEMDRDRPFFLYVAFTAPHYPLHAIEEYIERYDGTYSEGWDSLRVRRFERMKTLGVLPQNAVLPAKDPMCHDWKDDPEKDWQQRRMETFAAMVEQMDEGIGKIVGTLRKTGEVNNTIVIFLSDNGQVMSLHKHKVEFANEHIECPAVLVDGFGIGDVGNAVLKDRKLLSEGGLIIVAATIDRDLGMVVSGPDIISKGFVYVKEAEDLLTVAAKVARDAMDRFDVSKMKDYGPMKSAVRNAMQDFIYKTTKRSPVIMPIFMEL